MYGIYSTLSWLVSSKTISLKNTKDANPHNTLAKNSSARELENELFLTFSGLSASWPSCGDFFLQLLSGTPLCNSVLQRSWQWLLAIHICNVSFTTLFCKFFSQLLFYFVIAILLPNILQLLWAIPLATSFCRSFVHEARGKLNAVS